MKQFMGDVQAKNRMSVEDPAAASQGNYDGANKVRISTTHWFLPLLAAWQVPLVISFLTESQRLRLRLLEDGTPGCWWDAPALDGTFYVPLLLLAPFCWSFPCRLREDFSISKGGSGWGRMGWKIWSTRQRKPIRVAGLVCSLLIAVVAGVMSDLAAETRVAEGNDRLRVSEALPLVQDELSYELQARTFLAGRWWWPGPSQAPELFHQTHVLNAERFASRYFPGTGLWLAPWLALGQPTWGERCAGMLACVGFFWVGCELKGLFAGGMAGLLIACSPGLAIFDNLLLAHAPALFGISLFLYGMFRLMRQKRPVWAWLAGVGLSFAMLCRPLTAAAIALPFGVWVLSQGFPLRRAFIPLLEPRASLPIGAIFGLGIPLLAGLAIVGCQNQAITQNWWTAPYAVYTQTYTPRHAYGFHNGSDLAIERSSLVLRNYDAWAKNLDWPLAWENVQHRLLGSFAWSMGVIPGSLTFIVSILTFPRQPLRVRLLLLSILSLHLAHIPYWLDGMLGHHYVFESGPLWIVLGAILSVDLLRCSMRRGHWLFPLWWLTLIFLLIFQNWVPIGGVEAVSRVQQGWKTFLHSTQNYRRFEKALKQTSLSLPALVLIQSNEEDLHVQYVRNLPPFDSELLVATDRPELYSVQELQVLFPARSIYRYDTRKQRFLLTARPLERSLPEVE